jgi:hypothetical protein
LQRLMIGRWSLRVRVWGKRIVVRGGDMWVFVFCFSSWESGLLLVARAAEFARVY